MRLISGNIIPLIVSGCHSKLYTSGFDESKDMVNILTILHNMQFTRSFQMSLPGIKLSKILIIFFAFQ